MRTYDFHTGPVMHNRGEVIAYADTITEMKSDKQPCKIIFQTVMLAGQELRFMTIFVGYMLVSRERIL